VIHSVILFIYFINLLFYFRDLSVNDTITYVLLQQIDFFIAMINLGDKNTIRSHASRVALWY